MTEQLTQDPGPGPAGRSEPAARPTGRRGRRAVVLGAVAAGAGAAVSLVGGGVASAAPDGDPPVALGAANTETSTTTISNADSGAITGNTSANGGHSGVHGKGWLVIG
jgi:hypothetical protein